MILAVYDGNWNLPEMGIELHQFTTLLGYSRGASWTCKPGQDLKERFSHVEERFRFQRCPSCGAGVRALPVALQCTAGCGWERWKKEAAA